MRIVGVIPDQAKGAGYALLEIDGDVKDAQLELAFFDIDHGYLWPSSSVRTTWRNEPYYFKVVRVDGEKSIFRIGPNVCNYLAPDSLIDIRFRDGDVARGLAWGGVPILVLGDDENDVIDPPSPPPSPSPARPLSAVQLIPEPGEKGPSKPDGETSFDAGSSSKPDSADARSDSKKRSPAKLWLTMPLLAAAAFVFALSRGLDWEVSAPNPITFQRIAAGYSPNEVKVLIKRAWWSAWIDSFIDPRVELVTNPLVYASNYQPGSVRSFDLRLRLPSDVNETEISFRHSATTVGFGQRRVSIRAIPGELVVTATDELKFSGPKGGPFSPTTLRLTVSSHGAGFLWSVVSKPDWLNVSPDSGSISENKSQDVELKTNAQAGSKEVGSYPDTLIIKSPTAEVKKAVVLMVQAPAPPVDVVAQCDALAGSRFDTDRPNTTPLVDNMLASPDADVDTAIAACGAAATAKGFRRFYAQLGRAYATRAEKQAIAGNDDAARSTMALALSAWRTAASQGSGSAMNFLGAYYMGTYNDEVAPGRKGAGLAPFTFNSPSLDTALKQFQDAARNSNVTGMRNAGSLLLGDMDPPPPFQPSVQEGVQWLKKAVSAGDSKAAVVLGKAFYTGSPREVLRYAETSPPAKEQALQLLGKACSDTTDPSAKYSAKEFLDKVTSHTYVGSGGRLEPSRRPAECS